MGRAVIQSTALASVVAKETVIYYRLPSLPAFTACLQWSRGVVSRHGL